MAPLNVIARRLLGNSSFLPLSRLRHTSTMDTDGYRDHSSNQLSAHAGCAGLLSSSMERLAKRIEFEDGHAAGVRRRRIADLGSADGSNSMAALRGAVDYLRGCCARSGMAVPLDVTFEEHPASDERGLRLCLEGHGDWFAENDITWSVLMKSFYEPLFEPDSMDFICSYICLHWLDTEGGTRDWKSLHLGKEGNDHPSLANFTFVAEVTAPKSLKEIWRTELANVHLAKFFALRARELRPGGEALVVMLGDPNQIIVPSPDAASPLTQAMRRCVGRGVLREEVLRRCVVPYYPRTEDDLREAFKLASEIGTDGAAGTPGAPLQLVDVRSYPGVIGDGESLDGSFELFWSIHSGSVWAADPTEEEMGHIRREAATVRRAVRCERGYCGDIHGMCHQTAY